jgi:hypothetical protein
MITGIVVIAANFIYKTSSAPTKTDGRYASFYAFVKNFLKCDSISTTIRQVAISIIAICVHPD